MGELRIAQWRSGCARAFALLVLAASCAMAPRQAAQSDPSADPAALRVAALAIAKTLQRETHPWLRRPSLTAEAQGLDRLYTTRDHRPLWFGAAGEAPSRASEALALLAGAAVHGLDPADYDANELDARWRAFDSARAGAAVQLGLLDLGLSTALLRFVGDLQRGRVSPSSVDFAIEGRRERPEPALLIETALREGSLAALPQRAEPQRAIYRRLAQALAHYRELAADPGLAPPAFEALPLKPGDPLPRAATLAHWLAALGDLPTPSSTAGEGGPVAPGPAPGAESVAAPQPTALEAELRDGVYGPALAAAVAAFQRRHGLETDGVIGAQTAQALATPLAVRVRQIELALERFRWLPDFDDRRFVVVNAPAFELMAFDRAVRADGPELSMRVVVGKAGRTPTPVFLAALKEVVFGPYWNVPRSIAKNELLPKIARDPGYLAKEQMEIVAEGRVVAATPENLARVRAGRASLRQRPGAINALGRVKFLFPNPYSVYMHDTPARTLFAHSRRDFSHGCVRVEQPEALANWVLRGEAGWDAAHIAAELQRTSELRVSLSAPIPVMVFYATALARADGSVHFFPDLYGHDAELERALAARR